MSIRIFYDETSFRYRGWRKLEEILKEIISKGKKSTGDIHIIITRDEKLREINIRFLEHDYYTDVITFNYNSGSSVNGEIYVSLDTVRANSINYNVSLINEMTRVIIHGLLHLMGHDDKSKQDRNRMRRLEDLWIKRIGKGKNGLQV